MRRCCRQTDAMQEEGRGDVCTEGLFMLGMSMVLFVHTNYPGGSLSV